MRELAKSIGILLIVFVFAAASSAQKGFVVTASGLKYKDLETGTGETAETGKIAVIHFVAWLDDNGKKGKQFFNSRVEEKPVAFKIGADIVIPGWNIGVAGMKVGGKRRLMIPAALGYGSKGAGEVVPPNADLIFDVELIEVKW